ncbi:acyl carrier protein [Acetivibrio cellulolyticus]|uniref:acyl carrier protein n=1 Tax=Acetivibrio cellulolyticus TaxID=35830 RepID=UPI0001E2C727|nr:acyl carrier protein [Acetivibrio cellulolyticus]
MNNKIEWSDFVQKVSEYTGIEVSEINEGTNIYSDLGMDSLGLFSLGMFLIKEYGIKIPLSSVATIEAVGDIYKLMNEQ